MNSLKSQIDSVLSKYPSKVVEMALEKERLENITNEKYYSEIQKRKKEAMSSLLSFIEIYFVHYFDKSFGEQQQELVQDIELFQNKNNREPIKLLRALSRGFGKSTLMSLCGVLWLILRKEWIFVIMVSSTLESSKGFLRKIIEEVEDNEKLISDFPELQPAIDIKGQRVSWKDTDIVFKGGGRVIAKGFLNAIRGQRHKQYRPSALIIDDPDEEKDVSSESIMIRKYRWLDRAALRLGTAWGIDVMLSYTTISPNCVGENIFNDNEKYWNWNKKKFKAIDVDSKGIEYSTWEAGAPLEILKKEREADPITFARERQNEVLAEIDQKFKGFIQTYTFNREDFLSKHRKVLAVDLSSGKSENSDFSAIIGVALTNEGEFREIYSSIERRRPDRIVEDLIEALQLLDWECCVIEENGGQDQFIETFRMLLKIHNAKSEKKILTPIEGLYNGGEKIKRITDGLQSLVAGGLLKIREDSKLLHKQLDEFPYQKKDGPDALEMGIRYLRKNQPVTSTVNFVTTKNSNSSKITLEKIRKEQIKKRGY